MLDIYEYLKPLKTNLQNYLKIMLILKLNLQNNFKSLKINNKKLFYLCNNFSKKILINK